MPNLPVTASSRELQRPRPIPRRVRDVITLMVYGRIDDEKFPRPLLVSCTQLDTKSAAISTPICVASAPTKPTHAGQSGLW